jgi:hypothetical protein
MASRSKRIAPFTGLQPGQFRKLVRLVAERDSDEIANGRSGRQWAVPLADRVGGAVEELPVLHNAQIAIDAEHTLARMKRRKILRDHRRAASTPADTVSGTTHPTTPHSLADRTC